MILSPTIRCGDYRLGGIDDWPVAGLSCIVKTSVILDLLLGQAAIAAQVIYPTNQTVEVEARDRMPNAKFRTVFIWQLKVGTRHLNGCFFESILVQSWTLSVGRSMFAPMGTSPGLPRPRAAIYATIESSRRRSAVRSRRPRPPGPVHSRRRCRGRLLAAPNRGPAPPLPNRPASHAVTIQKADEINARLRAFLDQCEAAG